MSHSKIDYRFVIVLVMPLAKIDPSIAGAPGMPEPILLSQQGARETPADDAADGQFERWRDSWCKPDVLLPVQFNDLTRRRHYTEGERRLAVAVLEDAIRIYLKGMIVHRREDGKEEFLEVTKWFSCRSRSPFTFEYICEALDVDALTLRRRLTALTIAYIPNKQVHSVGRRQVMRLSSRMKRRITQRPCRITKATRYQE